MTTRVAILGGGVGAMAAAFALTAPEQEGRYEVTVYQMGWRLGGKGASGRDPSAGNRIEEHGLHVWMGFYENAFRVMRACYAELARAPGAPLATWEDAFKPHSYIVLMEQLDDGLHPWELLFPTTPEKPGDPGLTLPDAFAFFQSITRWLGDRWASWPTNPRAGDGPDDPPADDGTPPEPPDVPPWVREAHDEAVASQSRLPAGDSPDDDTSGGRVDPAGFYFQWAMDIVASLGRDASSHPPRAHQALIWLLRAFMEAVWLLVEGSVGTDLAIRTAWVGINLAGATAVGFLHDGLLSGGWSNIDHLDFREWMRGNGANDVTLESGIVRGGYDLVFGMVGGETKRERCAAGVALYGLLRMMFTYRGAIFWEMQAGMGDTVFAPLHEVLCRRGVKFEFFHRVTDLHLTGDRTAIGSIDLVRQVALRGARYDPLVDVGGLPCWPNAPRWEQIQGGDELRASGINLESAWALRWRDETPRTLTRGVDFDAVVLGISVAALPAISGELQAASRPYADMLANLQTVQTFGHQLWLTPDLAGLGWKKEVDTEEAPVLTAYAEPINTWGDLSHLLGRETWSGATPPRSAVYLCGPFPDAPEIPPPFTGDPRHAGFPAAERARYDALAETFLDQGARGLWPAAVDGRGALDRSLVVSEYRRVNIDPTERYVLSVPGSTRYRLRADASGFANLYLAGDWTENVINASCVEAAVISGLRAAQALSGLPRDIAGDTPDGA